MSGLGHRRLVVVRGAREQTARAAAREVAGFDAARVLWVGDDLDVSAAAGAEQVALARVSHLLGTTWDAVVLDLHHRLDLDALGRCHGFVRGGGVFAIRLESSDRIAQVDREPLVVAPYGPEHVGARWVRHLERALARAAAGRTPPITESRNGLALDGVEGSIDQARAVEGLAVALVADRPSACVLVAGRGRGKSAALGLALARLPSELLARTVVTGPSSSAYAEVLRFAGREVRVATPLEVASSQESFAVVVVDEAAQIPVPVLQRIARRHSGARLALATTTHGYEGTGRGFVLRFLEWLRARSTPCRTWTLAAPIRWAPGDPVEAFAFDALLLDAEAVPPASAGEDAGAEGGSAPGRRGADVVVELVDRDGLVEDEGLLRQVVGLLVHAHYRTAPSDVRRILDAPNLGLHLAMLCGVVAGVCLVAEEGGLAEEESRRLLTGVGSIRGHALAETLAMHLGRAEGARMRLARSVRIAVHPDARRSGVASRLVEHVHATYPVDLFGTVFGATTELIAFRRSLGYEVVRVSASRGARTGEPAVAMVRPVSDAASALVEALRAELALELPAQLAVLSADDELVLEPALCAALSAGLEQGAPSRERAAVAAREYAYGPRTFESLAGSITAFARQHAATVAALPAAERAVVEARVIEGRGWAEAQRRAGLPSPAATMRTLRRAIRRIAAT